MIFWLLACVAERPPSPGLAPPSFTDTESTGPLADSGGRDPACPSFGSGVSLGEVASDTLTEASGLASVDGVFWTHGDSGSAAALVALAPDGQPLGEVPLVGVDAVDTEDIAYLPTQGGALLLGDIGDNLALREQVSLLVAPVPDPRGGPVPARTVRLTWPDGPRDAETLLADPVTGDVLVVSKSFDGLSVVARVASPLPDSATLEPVAVLPFGSDALPGDKLTTGGDIAPDGTGVVIRTYLAAWIWPRIPGEPWPDTFGRTPCRVEIVVEPQGEAIAWGPEGLTTVSEGHRPVLWRYPPS